MDDGDGNGRRRMGDGGGDDGHFDRARPGQLLAPRRSEFHTVMTTNNQQ